MFDHIGFNVKNFEKCKDFYTKSLKPLGIKITKEGEKWVMMQKDNKGGFWFGEYGDVPTHVHIAFAAENRKQVDMFYKASIAAGGKDNGAPGIRSNYHNNYYAAFVLDPNGHNIEAVCHIPE